MPSSLRLRENKKTIAVFSDGLENLSFGFCYRMNLPSPNARLTDARCHHAWQIADTANTGRLVT
tara:strand:+ start:642 stop:833 length:192 start_codon:yes stop_codon:yes gene_type:complete